MSDHDPQPAGSARDAAASSSAGRSEGDQTLARLLQQRNDPTSDRAKLLLILERAARAAAEVHERGQILPGLSPASLRVDAAGRVTVVATPVPIPRTLADADGNPAEGLDPAFGEAVARSAPYVSPEVARLDPNRIDERADVFALGSVLCEILTGAPAYVGNTPEKVRLRAAKGDLAETFARLDGSGAGDEVVALTRSCLSTSLAVRPRTAGDLAERLSAAFAARLSRLSMAEALLRQEAERASAAEALAKKRRGLGWKGVAALLFFMLVVAAGAAAAAGWAVHWRQTRLGVVDLAVNEAILRSSIGAAGGEGSAAQFEAAKTAVTRAGKGLDGVPYASRARAQLAETSNKVDLLAAAALADRALVERVELARGGSESAAEANRAYREAFLTAGIDLDKTEPAEIGRVLLSRPASVALSAAQGMDFWSMIPDPATNKPDPAARSKRLAVARAADPDPWRNRVRDAVLADDKTACRRLWLEREFQLQGPETHNFYARALLSLGETALALDVLQAVVNRNPGDYWANATLSEIFLISMRQTERKAAAAGPSLPTPGAAPAPAPSTAQDLGRRAEPYARAALAAKPASMPVPRAPAGLRADGRRAGSTRESRS
ncbi:MAG: hypothetical protein U0835_26180 [Isosphaeraceae bacterium]